MRRIRTAFPTAIAIGFGLLTLIGLLLGESGGILYAVSNLFLQVAAITLAFSVVIGVINLFRVHGSRLARRKGGWVYSLVLLVSALAAITLIGLERMGYLGGRPSPSAQLLETAQISIESALGGLVLFALVYGAFRYMRNGVTWTGMGFTAALLFFLLGALPLPELQPLTAVREWLLSIPVSAGARGILLGIALAITVAGVRVLIGQDRSYRE